MQQTGDQLPAIIVPNTTVGVDWQDPTNIFFADDQFAVAGGNTQILEVSFVGRINVPVGATVNNIVISVKGYRGSFNTTLQIYAIDSSSGVPVAFPMTPSFQGFNGVNTLYSLTPTLFGNVWSATAINNLSLRLIADGELYLDTVMANVLYTPVVVPASSTPLSYTGLTGAFQIGETITGGTSGATAVIVTNDGISQLTLTSVIGTFIIGETITGSISAATATVANPSGQTVCDEFVQAQLFQLSQSMTSTSLYMLLESFNYPDGVTPIQMADFHGDAYGVIDQGVPGKEETVRFVSVEQNYAGTGKCRIGFGTIANRGLNFQYPYTNVPAYQQDHSGVAEFVLSNPAVFYSRFLKTCQADALYSVPIEIFYNSVSMSAHVHSLDFQGAVVVDIPNPLFPDALRVTITGPGNTPPVLDSTSSTTSGPNQVTSLTWAHTTGGINRGMVVQISCEQAATIASVTYNGIPLTQEVSDTDVPNNLRQEQWSLLAPPVGTYNIVVTFSVATYCCAGAETFVNVNQTAFIGATQSATGSSLAPSLVLVTTSTNSVVVDGLVTAQPPIFYTAGPGQTENWHRTAATDTCQGASSLELAGSAPDNVTMDWTLTQNTDWVLTAVEVIGISNLLSPISTYDEGILVDGNTIKYNFVGPNIVATQVAPGEVDITVSAAPASQTSIQFQDEGVDLGTPGTVDTVDVVGAGGTATRLGNVLTLTIPGGTSISVINVSRFDDFLGGGSDAFRDFVTGSAALGMASIGELGWTGFYTASGNGAIDIYGIPGEAGRPGIIRIESTSSNGSGGIRLSNQISFITDTQTNDDVQFFNAQDSTGIGAMNQGNWSITFSMRPSATNLTRMEMGLQEDPSNNAEGIYFELSGGNWRGVCSSANVDSVTASTAAATTAFAKFEIIMNAAGTSVEFKVDGVSLGSVTTNIPNNQGRPFFYMDPVAVSGNYFDIDYWLMDMIVAAR